MQGDIFTSLLPLFVLFAIFYFLVFRPQQKQAKEHKNTIGSLEKGDKVVTNFGLIAEVVKVEEKYFKIKIDDDVVVKIVKEYVARKIEDESKL